MKNIVYKQEFILNYDVPFDIRIPYLSDFYILNCIGFGAKPRVSLNEDILAIACNESIVLYFRNEFEYNKNIKIIYRPNNTFSDFEDYSELSSFVLNVSKPQSIFNDLKDYGILSLDYRIEDCEIYKFESKFINLDNEFNDDDKININTIDFDIDFDVSFAINFIENNSIFIFHHLEFGIKILYGNKEKCKSAINNILSSGGIEMNANFKKKLII